MYHKTINKNIVPPRLSIFRLNLRIFWRHQRSNLVAVNRRRNRHHGKWKNPQAMIYETLHRQLIIEQQEHH
jgi:hypothetical protein